MYAATVRVRHADQRFSQVHRLYAGRFSIEPLRDRMDREYAQPLDVPGLARTALMSTAHFSRRFREAYSETPYAYLMTRRIERAKACLRRGDMSVTQVCSQVGFQSLGSFSTRFSELVDESPSAYAARNRVDRDEFSWITLVTESHREVPQEPADQPWGVRDGAVRGPAGNLVRIEQG